MHSPIEIDENTKTFLSELGGGIAALIAPNKVHYVFIESWRKAFPNANVFVEAELAGKVPSLANGEILTKSAPSLYSQDVDQAIFSGNRMFQETVFFHKASGSVIFTDLMINLTTEEITPIPRLFLELEGVTYSHGGIPRLYRWFTTDKDEARKALRFIRKWRPTRVRFCHGEPFELTGQEVLDREFAYLK